MKNLLKNRELTQEAKDILFAYFMEDITYIQAHNKLILLGINLTEDGRLLDY